MASHTRILLIAAVIGGALYFAVKHYRNKQSEDQENRKRGASPQVEEDMVYGDDSEQGNWDSQFASSNKVTPRCGSTSREENFEGDSDVSAPTGAKDDDGWGMYDAEQYLPQEKTSNWFETVEVPQTNKNQHLLSNQIGIGTSSILGSRRNWSHDIRPDPPCPKIANISPWNQSTIMPSERNKSLC
jgi:hypothetical protein